MKISIPHAQRTPDFARMYTDFHDTAFTRAIGMELMHCERGRVISQAELHPFNASTHNPEALDPLTTIGLIDHSGGSSIYTLIDTSAGCSTFDLRIDFISTNTGSCLTATTRVDALLEDRAVIHSEVHNPDGELVATGTGLFRIGGFPGDIKGQGQTTTDYQPPASSRSFADTLAIKHANGQSILTAQNPAVIGWSPSRAYHGGATAILLAEACCQQMPAQSLRSLHVTYIRPGRGDHALTATASPIRLGNAASFIQASCCHEDQKVIAQALATFS